MFSHNKIINKEWFDQCALVLSITQWLYLRYYNVYKLSISQQFGEHNKSILLKDKLHLHGLMDSAAFWKAPHSSCLPLTRKDSPGRNTHFPLLWYFGMVFVPNTSIFSTALWDTFHTSPDICTLLSKKQNSFGIWGWYLN